jgi:hypothetical protein
MRHSTLSLRAFGIVACAVCLPLHVAAAHLPGRTVAPQADSGASPFERALLEMVGTIPRRAAAVCLELQHGPPSYRTWDPTPALLHALAARRVVVGPRTARQPTRT